MTYTYDDFVNAAKAAGMYDGFSQEDLTTAQNSPEYGLSLLKLQQDMSGAKTAEQRMLAQEAMNQLRISYGQIPASASSVGSDGKIAYQLALEKVAGQGSFSYNPAEDPSYGATKKNYLREGQRAMEGTLAKASGSTGGVPSSYAITAAQQANDYYTTQFNDIVPTLQQNAYQRYLSDFANEMSKMEALKEEEQRRIENALLSYQTLGYATPEVAQILGISTSGGSGRATGSTGMGGPGANYLNPAMEEDDALRAKLAEMEEAWKKLQTMQQTSNTRSGGTSTDRGGRSTMYVRD